VENGRIKDSEDVSLKTGFRRLVETFRPGIRLTPQQNMLFTDIAEEHKPTVDALLRDHNIAQLSEVSNALRYAMACPALPTCGLAMSDAERALPSVVRGLEREIARLGLEQEKIWIRMTGCPNGCARPYLGDLGFVGRTLNAYNVYVGGDFEGTRLNQLYADMIHTDQLVNTVVPLLIFYKENRLPGERFGDFCHRVGVEALREFAAAQVSS
jgi:sulfite reductase (ferredoxin)